MGNSSISDSAVLRIRLVSLSFVFLFHLFFYLMTIAPTVTFWDAGEFIATSHILGIPHPPGTPFFVLLGRVWTLLPFATVAFKMNLFSTICGAVSATLFYLVISKILEAWVDDVKDRSAQVLINGGGISAAICSSFMITVWENTTETEVYVLALVTISLFAWITLRWRESLTLGKGGNSNLIILMSFIAGLSVGNHLMALLAGPPIILFILMINWRSLVNPWTLVGIVVMFALGLSIHLYLPLRASLNPSINEADPSTAEAFWEVLARKQYGSRSMFVRTCDFFQYQVPLYFIYFKEQFGSHLLAWPFGALGLWGMWDHFRKEKNSFSFLFLLFLLTSFGLILYLNFKIGHTQALAEVPNPELHEVRERDYFFIVSFVLFGLFVGIGLASVFNVIRKRLPDLWKGNSLLLCSLGVLIFSPSMLPLALNYERADRSNNYIAYDYAYNILQSVEPYGIIFTNGDNDTFPLWFLQEVIELRKDITVVNLSLLNTTWYIKQIRDRKPPLPEELSPETREFFENEGYDLEGMYPSGSVIDLTDMEVDLLIPRRIPREYHFTAGRLSKVYPKRSVFFVKDLMILHMLKINNWNRPIYFAVTVSDDNKANLFDYMVMEGLVYKIHEDKPESLMHIQPEIAYIPETKTYINIGKSIHMLEEVYAFRGIFDDEVYKTRNTRKLLNNYAAAYSYLGRSLLGRNDLKSATRCYEMAYRFASNNNRFLYLLATLYAQDGQGAKADSLFQEFVSTEAVDPRYLFQMSSFLIRGGDTTRSVRYLEELITVAPDQKEAYLRLRRHYLQVGDTLKASEIGERWEEGHKGERLN